jgi:hypothetical protein
MEPQFIDTMTIITKRQCFEWQNSNLFRSQSVIQNELGGRPHKHPSLLPSATIGCPTLLLITRDDG